MILYYFFGSKFNDGGLFLFILFAIIPTIICVWQLRKINQKYVKIIMGIAGFLLSYFAILGWYFLQGFWANTPDTKKCPYCNGEILITAKKCKHCSEWVEDK